MELLLQLNPPIMADFKEGDSIGNVVEELTYLHTRMKYYKETVTLAQITGLLSMIENINDNNFTQEECEKREDEARSEGIEEGKEEAEMELSKKLQKVLDNHSRTCLDDEVIEAEEYNKLILELENII